MLPIRLPEVEIRRRPLPPAAVRAVVETVQVENRRSVDAVLVEAGDDLGRRYPPAAAVKSFVPHAGSLVEVGDRTVHFETRKRMAALRTRVVVPGGMRK